MIPQVTVANSENGDYGRAILSDMSDEMLIKQLQLNMNQNGSNTAFQSSSNVLYDVNTNSLQPLREITTNQHSPAKQSIITEAEIP